MAEAYKVLGQVAPSATTLTTLYTVPALTSTVVSSIVVANTSSSADTFRIAIEIAGAGDDIKQYLYRDITIPGNNTFEATMGITLATTDVVKCYSGSGNCSFNMFGTEIT